MTDFDKQEMEKEALIKEMVRRGDRNFVQNQGAKRSLAGGKASICNEEFGQNNIAYTCQRFDQCFQKARVRLEQGLAALARRENAPSARLLEPSFAEALLELMRLVLERNEAVNLTSITEPLEFVCDQLLDSLACTGRPEMESAKKVVDIGSGAGFPGLPLALLYPDKMFLLTDALRKRTDFVNETAAALGLSDVTAIHMRAEEAGHVSAYREQFDLAVCRAVATLPVVLEYTLPFVKVGGNLFAYKTVQAKGEIEESRLALEQLGASPDMETFTYTDLLPDSGYALYITVKNRPTPDKYPRRAGIPTKVPL